MTEDRLVIAKNFAEAKGGQCLSNQYINTKTKMLWQCHNPEHKPWVNTYAKIINVGAWCPRCAGHFPSEEKLLNAQKHAESKGGQCLSSGVYNSKNKLEWKCHNVEHKSWFAFYDSVVNNGSWCPRCVGRFTKEETLEYAKKHAENKDGLCLSTEYKAKKKLKWQCNNGHQWNAIFDSVINNNSWCPYCAGSFGKFTEKEGLEIAKKHAEDKGGQCLSSTYKNYDSKLMWQCSNGHQWESKFRKVISELQWCKKCNHESLKIQDALTFAKKHAELKGGKCLSDTYINIKSKLKWQCAFNHIWEAPYDTVVIRNYWCSQCSYFYYKEHKIRNLLEYLFDKKFPKIRPNWNINPKTNIPLELDGYCEELKIAFEFQGIQHYQIGGFTKTQEELDYTIYKDFIKTQNCIKKNIKLLIIDDKFKQEQIQEILEYVLSIIKSQNIKLIKNIIFTEVEDIFNKTIPQQLVFLESAKELAESKDGQCVSTEYINKDSKLKWQCKEGHQWNSSFHSVVNHGSWCPQCAGQFLPGEGLNKAQKYAESKGGLCLSTKYVNAKTKLHWQCKNQHQWNAVFDSVVKNGAWCPICYGRFTKEEGLIRAKNYAESKGGLCLSSEYINARSKLKWQCKEGHVWERVYESTVNRETWCPQCKKKKTKSPL